MHIPADGGGFHVKAASLPIGPGYTAIKVNGNFPNNRAKHGLPTIQGAILLFDTVDRFAGRAAQLDRDHHQAHRRRDRGRRAVSRAARVANRDHLGLRRAGPAQLAALRQRSISAASSCSTGMPRRRETFAERDRRARVSMSMFRQSRARVARQRRDRHLHDRRNAVPRRRGRARRHLHRGDRRGQSGQERDRTVS